MTAATSLTIERSLQAAALIEHIQTRFHDGHRRALPGLLALAAAVEANGIDAALVDALRTIGDELDRHLFKEEMRLFPMMAQGGNTLIGRLIEDLHREHGVHACALDELRARLRLLGQLPRTDPLLHALTRGVDELADELMRHIRTEDEELFPLFAAPVPSAAPAAFDRQPPTPTQAGTPSP